MCVHLWQEFLKAKAAEGESHDALETWASRDPGTGAVSLNKNVLIRFVQFVDKLPHMVMTRMETVLNWTQAELIRKVGDWERVPTGYVRQLPYVQTLWKKWRDTRTDAAKVCLPNLHSSCAWTACCIDLFCALCAWMESHL